MVALKQSRYAAALCWLGRNVQQQVTFPQRLVVDLQGRLVVAEPLEGSHDAGSQSVVAAMLIQDARSLLTAQDLHGGDIHPGRCEVSGEGRDLRLLTQQTHHMVDGPVIEVIDVDLGLVHATAPSRVFPGTMGQHYPYAVLPPGASPPNRHRLTSLPAPAAGCSRPAAVRSHPPNRPACDAHNGKRIADRPAG